MFPLCTLDYVVIPVFTRIVLNMSIVSVLLKLFKCCKRQPTIIFVVLCDYKLVWSNVTRRWIFDFFEFFFFRKKMFFFFGNFFFPSGSSAFFRPHFCNSHEYHPYSSNWYPNFLWNFTSKSRVKVRLAIFSKFYRLFFDFYNLHIKPNVLNLTLFRRKMNPRKIATIEAGKQISKTCKNLLKRVKSLRRTENTPLT